MPIPKSAIEKLNQAFGVPGRPRRAFENGYYVDTGCYEWKKQPDVGDAVKNISPELVDAMQRSQAFLQEALQADPGMDPQKKMDEFYAKEPEQVRAEFARLNSRLQEAWQAPQLDFQPPPTSPEMQAAMQRINGVLAQENFEKNGQFDLNAYEARIKELWKKEPPHLQAEAEALGQAYAAATRRIQRRYQRSIRHKRLALKEARELLEGEPVVAYRGGILFEGVPSGDYDTIVVAPSTDQMDILRIEQTRGNNHPLSTEELIDFIRTLDKQFGVDITGAALDAVEFTLQRVPKGEEAQELGRRLLEICPDLYEAPRRFPKGRVTLWWD